MNELKVKELMENFLRVSKEEAVYQTPCEIVKRVYGIPKDGVEIKFTKRITCI